jgi:hypothetical protein
MIPEDIDRNRKRQILIMRVVSQVHSVLDMILA